MDADTAWVCNHFTHHVFGSLVSPQLRTHAVHSATLHHRAGLAADGPLGDVIWPLIGSDGGRGFTELGVKATHGARDSASWTSIPSRPFLPCGDGRLEHGSLLALLSTSQHAACKLIKKHYIITNSSSYMLHFMCRERQS